MQALKLHVTVDDSIVHALPALSPLLGQHIELIALGEDKRSGRKLPIPGEFAGKITVADDFDAPLPDELIGAFEGEMP
jgi:hypothetical protein